MSIFDFLFKRNQVTSTDNVTEEKLDNINDNESHEENADQSTSTPIVSVRHLNTSFRELGLFKRDFIPVPSELNGCYDKNNELDKTLIYERVVFLRNLINVFDYSWKTEDIEEVHRYIEYDGNEDYTLHYSYGCEILESIYNWYHARLKQFVDPTIVPMELPISFRQIHYTGLKYTEMYLSGPEYIRDESDYLQQHHQYGYVYAVLLVGILSGSELLPLNKKAKKIATYFNKIVKDKWDTLEGINIIDYFQNVGSKLLFGLITLRLLHEPDWDGTLYDGTKLEGVRELFELPNVKQMEKQ